MEKGREKDDPLAKFPQCLCFADTPSPIEDDELSSLCLIPFM